MEMPYGPPSVMIPPFLLHVWFVGGPPVVTPIRVKVGGVDWNDEIHERDTTFESIAPLSVV